LWTAVPSPNQLVGLRMRGEGSASEPKIPIRTFSQEALTEEEIKGLLEDITRSGETRVDLRDFYSLGGSDPLISKAVHGLYGMRCGKTQKIFHELLWGIANQNAPLRRTQEMISLILENYGDSISFDGHELISFPSPDVIAGVSEEELRASCKLGFRAKYLKGIAEAIVSGECPTMNELSATSFKEAKESLMRFNGIGEYTAEFSLPHPERFPLDVWSLKILWRLLFPTRPMPTSASAIGEVRQEAEDRWGKWRGYAFIYILNDTAHL